MLSPFYVVPIARKLKKMYASFFCTNPSETKIRWADAQRRLRQICTTSKLMAQQSLHYADAPFPHSLPFAFICKSKFVRRPNNTESETRRMLQGKSEPGFTHRSKWNFRS